MRLSRMLLCGGLLFILGCAGVPLNEDDDARLRRLDSELKQQQEENLSLKRQLDQIQQSTIRMPTGEEIQTALKHAGFYQGKIDGQIATQTKEAIKKFQEANGLNPDGVVGSRTWELLIKYLQSS